MYWYIIIYTLTSLLKCNVEWSILPASIMFFTSCMSDKKMVSRVSVMNFIMSMLINRRIDNAIQTSDMSIQSHIMSIPYLYAIFFIQSTLFYIVHRLLHTSFLYRRIHYIHHQFITRSWWTAFHCHPIEMICILFTFQSPKLLSYIIPIPYSVLMTWNITSSTYFLHTHGKSTFPFWFDLNNHMLHHIHYNCNYSSEWIDRLFGTFRN